jgi:signal transduction histidine kinase
MKPSGSDHDFPIVVATKQMSQRQRRAAIAAVAVLFTGTMIWAPFGSVQLTRVDAFIPVIQSLMCVADLLTATLLFSQYAVQAQPAILMLASGYIAAGLFAFLQTLTFPGSYAPGGLFGDGIDTPAWLFVLWHTSFPLGVLLYALTKNGVVATGDPQRWSAGSVIAITVAGVGAAVAALTWVVTLGAGYLPPLYSSSVTRQTLAANYTNAILGLWYATALVVLIIRRRTILDLWLIVTLCAWVPNFLVAAFVTSVRFSLGWYSARIYALVASWTLLIVLLSETTLLYARLADALTLRQRERADRLMSVDAATAAMAHEVGNPLGSIAMNAATALIQLDAKPPELKDMRLLLEEIEAASHRAGGIIASVREMFATTTERRTLVHLGNVGRQVLSFLRDDLRTNAISVETDFRDGIPPVHADPTQIQQVILNLVKNAIEAMISTRGTRRLRMATGVSGNSVVLSVQDTGGGISSDDQDRIFDAFFTTKAAGTGMGLGLAISRTLVENHRGVLRLAKTDANGSVFEVAIPAA